MKSLQKDKAKIRKVIKDYQLPHKLYTEEIIAIIYRFTRKSGGECYYSAEQLGDICYTSYKPVQTLLKLLEAKELINIKRQYNSSNVLTMTPKLFNLLESDKVSEQSDNGSDPAGQNIQLTLSKEREKGRKKEKDDVSRFLKANPNIRGVFDNQTKAFGIEHAEASVLKIIKQREEQTV